MADSSGKDQASYDEFIRSDIPDGIYKGRQIKDLTQWRDEAGVHVLLTFADDAQPPTEILTFDYGVNVGPK